MSSRFELIPYHAQQILTVKEAGGIYVIMKPIIEALGIPWRPQRERITAHPVISKGVRLIRTPSAGGMQEMLALELEQFHGWLVTLETRRVKDERVRDNIVRYQADAFRVVFEHYHGKIGGPRITVRAATAQISLHNHYLALGKKLRNASDPAERQMIYSLLSDVADQIEKTPPPLEDLGREAPRAPEILEKFWHTFDILQERGHRINFARKPSLIAVHLITMQRAIDAEKLDFYIGTEVHEALEQCAAPKFIARKPINPKPSNPPDPQAPKSLHCWVFKRAA